MSGAPRPLGALLLATCAALGCDASGPWSLHPRGTASQGQPADATAAAGEVADAGASRAVPLVEAAPFIERVADRYLAPISAAGAGLAPWLDPGSRPAPVARTDAAAYFIRVRLLQEQLSLIVRRLRRSRVGLQVADEQGRVLFSHNARLSFNPASNVKLITAGAALTTLGPNHRFATEVRGVADADGVVGPLYLRGSGDPSLVTEDLIGLARQVAASGVARIRGPLVLDTSAVASPVDPPGYRRFSGSGPYRAGVSALSLNDNLIRVSVQPTEPGSPAFVTLFPLSPYLVRRGRVRTTRWGTRLHVKTYRHGDRTGVRVSGRVAVRHGLKRYWRRVFHPARYTGYVLLEQLRAEGISVGARLRVIAGRTPRRAGRLGVHRSAPLSETLRVMLKHSNNTKAEHLLLAAGAALSGTPATYPKARRALSRFLRRAGVTPGTYRLPNGSGLARRARLRPAAMVQVLAALHRDFAIGPDLLAALPLAGIDGTLRRRLRHDEIVGLVRAKTGTLAGVTCLSGFAGYRGRTLYFSIMALRAGPYWRVLRLQRGVARALIDYLRAGAAG